MDSKTLLDYALFQLTPTRTRCDLVVFSGKKSEKLASGLVEPFIAHLRYAKDHIPKAGYSFTLRPPAKADDISWFTKATFQRFVRFVRTPEILERIVGIEKEILQIDCSIQSTELPRLEGAGHPGEESLSVSNGKIRKANSSSKLTCEEDHEVEPRENSRIRLRNVMHTRKALLQKEQAMAYARAVVAGYEIDTIDDLVCFADAFGASRLRDACVDFKELYKKKHSDNQWMDELAAVQACSITDLSYLGASGIILTADGINGNAILSDSTTSTPTKENNVVGTEQTQNVQQQMAWVNQIPPYMYNFRGPVQQVPGYYPYYPGHVGWAPPSDVIQSKNHKPHRRKEKFLDENGTDSSNEDGENESGSGTESEDEVNELDKNSIRRRSSKNKKKGSKTVVIRNINYITSQNSGDSSENGEAHLKVHKNIGKQGSYDEDDENGKTCNAWDAFQNLLLTHEESDSSELPKHHPGEEHFAMKTSIGGHLRKANGGDDDSVIVVQREGSTGDLVRSVNFVNGEDIRLSKRAVLDGENAMFSEQYKIVNTEMSSPDFSTEQKTVKNRKEEDWFIVDNSSGYSERAIRKNLSYESDVFRKETMEGASVVDDSFIIDSRSAADEQQYSCNWTTYANLEDDNIDLPKPGIFPAVACPTEPDELCMALVRESQESSASWAPEMDYQVEISFNKADKKSSAEESNGKSCNEKKKLAGPMSKKNVSRSLSGGSLARSKADSVSKSKKMSPAMAHKNKSMKEEEERKRMEELLIQRQKRIAERTAATGLTSAACKKLPVGTKSTPRKPDKNRSPSMVKK